MAEKRRLTISLPEHIAAEIERRSKALDSNPTEYATDVIKWWYGEKSPPISTEERRLMETQSNDATRRAS